MKLCYSGSFIWGYFVEVPDDIIELETLDNMNDGKMTAGMDINGNMYQFKETIESIRQRGLCGDFWNSFPKSDNIPIGCDR